MSDYRTLIIEISDKTFDNNSPLSDAKDYRVRKASRGILIKNGQMALINMSNKNYHKLPGGGIENGETNTEAFKRELLEETGCDGEVKDEGPITLEYRDLHKLVQISYIFFAEIIGEIGEVKFEQGEIEEGAKLEWVNLEDVPKIMSEDKPTDYEDKFIHLRDEAILKYYQDRLDSNS